MCVNRLKKVNAKSKEPADCLQSAGLNLNFAYSPLPIMNFSKSATRQL